MSFQLLFQCVAGFLMIEVRTMEIVGLCAVLSGHNRWSCDVRLCKVQT